MGGVVLELYENRHGDRVPWDDLNQAEQEWHEASSPGVSIDDYCRNWERGEAFEDGVDDEAFDKDSD